MKTSRKYNILVVDDSATARESVTMILKDFDYEYDCVESGEKALQILGEKKFDIILLDLVMPGIGGLDTLRQIKDVAIPAEVIIISGKDSVDEAVACIKLGAFEYLRKPVFREELEITLLKAIESKGLKKEISQYKRAQDFAKQQDHFCAASNAMQRIVRLISIAAPTNSTILIEGESGTGKELVARNIYQQSNRSSNLFMAVNCGAFPEALLESELFGHEKGSFTGAFEHKMGLLEIVDNGTLFLDEVTEMSPKLQAVLLRVLEDGEFRRVGGSKALRTDVRIIAASNKNVHQEVGQGRFRDDLYYRLNVINIAMPPLRERNEDFVPLVNIFLETYSPSSANKKSLTPEALAMMQKYGWPGNVRELRNAIERLVILSPNQTISDEDIRCYLGTQIFRQAPQNEASNESLEAVERSHITRLLASCGGNKTEAAKKLGISIQTLYNKLKQYNVQA